MAKSAEKLKIDEILQTVAEVAGECGQGGSIVGIRKLAESVKGKMGGKVKSKNLNKGSNK
ncbi:MAG: hypothetical protein M3P33_01545 [bacterium]|nr:hypothetical protein [bacterium]